MTGDRPGGHDPGDAQTEEAAMGRSLASRFVVVLSLVLAMLLVGCSGDSSESSSDTDLPPQDGMEVGEEVPDFRLKNQDQETVVLSEQLAQGPVVLVFYPMAFTPV